MELTEQITLLIIQLFVILVVAKIFGELAERVFYQPAVLGELVAGMILGPFALGTVLSIPGLGCLFPLQKHTGSVSHGAEQVSAIPISTELWAIAQIGVVLLLFLAGLETDKKKIFRYGGPAFVVALGGIFFPFLFGAGAYALVEGKSFISPVALFMGAIMVATSVGVTARVLSDLNKINTTEGVTVLAAAVIDDVLGIIVLSIVVCISETGVVSAQMIAITAAKALGIWIGLSAVAILLSKWISKGILWFKTEGAHIALAVGFCFLAAALCEVFKLALIIGAYIAGLALSGTELDHRIQARIKAICHFIVPVFFVAVGMMVNFKSMLNMFWFGVLITILAIVGKVFGCGLPAMGLRFKFLSAMKIGVGMMPRAEVALVIASIGLTKRVIDEGIFGVSIMMTFVTTLLAPILLVPLFKKK